MTPTQNQINENEVNPQTPIQSNLPLCLILNSRSLYNKIDNLKQFLYQIAPDISLVSETWERQGENILSSTHFKVISYKRKQKKNNRQPGGGCAIIFNDRRFQVSEIDLPVPEGVEAAWAIFTPLSQTQNCVKKIAVGTFYVSPNSVYKTKSIDHIISSIHLLRSMHGNDIKFLLGGDLNRLKINKILEAYAALKQVISVPTRKSATLENLLTDMHTMYHPPTTIDPLQVDEDKSGSDSDHQMIIFAPLSNSNYRINRVKKTITTRPLPQDQIKKFGVDIISHNWEEVLSVEDANQKVDNFHTTIRTKLDTHFPVKVTRVSVLDQKWMNPQLKSLQRKVQREYYKHRKSEKWKKLRRRFRKMKRKTINSFYSSFVTELKHTNQGKWYQMAKKLGAIDQMNTGDISVEQLEGLDNKQAAQVVAEHFASVSNEYLPLDLKQLPAYLPAPKPEQVTEHRVYEKIQKLKNTRSTNDIDLPNKLRKEFSVELATPMTDIINTCLNQQCFPTLWKRELITPVPKITHPKVIKDLRKISGTSDFSKVYEGFLKDWIVSDISGKIDVGQYGGLKGSGTEHMLVCMVDRILRLLDGRETGTAVIASMIDWASAFDRQDPTLAIEKFIKLGVRPSIIPILVSYLSDRRMKVRFNGQESEMLSLIGGGPQGTLLGLVEYLVQSNDNADCVSAEDRFKYIDDLSVLEVIYLSGLLTDYDFSEHVASDIGIDQQYLPPTNYKMQAHLDSIAGWTDHNLMQVNASKSNYMIFSRADSDFATRLSINENKLDRIQSVKLVGVLLSENLSWNLNTEELCRKAYSRLCLITKLKYVGVSTEDLIDVYIKFIRSVVEYCSVVWHSSLTGEQIEDLERVQKTCLRLILRENYVSYEAAQEMCGLESLFQRREDRSLNFAKKCLKDPKFKKLFPLTEPTHCNTRESEKFQVNFARTSQYQKSTIPYLQRRLNKEFRNKEPKI